MNRSGSLARQVPILLRSRGQDRAIAGWIIDVPPSGVGALTRGFQSSTPAAIVARRLRERGVKKLPRGPRPTTQSNPGNLTSRELGVLGLVAQRLPNAQIAERLFLSTKTVDKHVSAALRKLGARSRAEASAEAVRLGIAERDRAR